MSRHLASTIAACAAALALLPATRAAAATTESSSSNWSGYVARGTSYKRVSATWTVAPVSCSGSETYSASWVGLGGYSSASDALEQAGTEADCSRSGRASYSAWYELVPQVGHDLSLTVHAGDKVSTSVAVSGHRVTVDMSDKTTGRRVVKHLTAASVDVSSADWIVEAPSLCDSSSLSSAQCVSSALADFGSTRFAHARATSASGHSGGVSDGSWSAVRISLTGASGFGSGDFGPPGVRDVAQESSGSATPSSLNAAGDSFAVTYGGASSTTTSAGRFRPATTGR